MIVILLNLSTNQSCALNMRDMASSTKPPMTQILLAYWYPLVLQRVLETILFDKSTNTHYLLVSMGGILSFGIQMN